MLKCSIQHRAPARTALPTSIVCTATRYTDARYRGHGPLTHTLSKGGTGGLRDAREHRESTTCNEPPKVATRHAHRVPRDTTGNMMREGMPTPKSQGRNGVTRAVTWGAALYAQMQIYTRAHTRSALNRQQDREPVERPRTGRKVELQA